MKENKKISDQEIIALLQEKGVPAKHLAEAVDMIHNAMSARNYDPMEAVEYVVGWVNLVEG